jgi:hypothetical protein
LSIVYGESDKPRACRRIHKGNSKKPRKANDIGGNFNSLFEGFSLSFGEDLLSISQKESEIAVRNPESEQ